jgi:hypothetical protein
LILLWLATVELYNDGFYSPPKSYIVAAKVSTLLSVREMDMLYESWEEPLAKALKIATLLSPQL